MKILTRLMLIIDLMKYKKYPNFTEDGKLKDDLGEFYHKPAANISQQQKTDKIRLRLEERKEKRKLEEK